MQVLSISSVHNALLKRVRGIHHRSLREKSGLFLIEGAKLINEAFSKNADVREIIVSQSFLADGLPQVDHTHLNAIYAVEDKLFCELITTAASCGILAVAAIKRFTLDQATDVAQPMILVAEGIQDPGNLGTMMRAALAFGASSMILTKGTVDPFNPKVVRSAMGALFDLPIVWDIPSVELMDSLIAKGIKIVALEPGVKQAFWEIDLTGPTALIFGNEGNGLAKATLSRATEIVSIPMRAESESLNVALAAGIVLFECARMRGTLEYARLS